MVADLLAQSSAWLEAQRHKHMTRSVTYQRGAESVELLATVGQSSFEQDDDGGGLVRFQMRDYLVLSADLVLGGHRVEPRRGDRITEVIDGQTCVFEVASGPGSGETEWRYSAPGSRQTIRIHTKQVGGS